MVPLEVGFGFIVILWGLVGAVRGFSKEAGSSIAIVLAMEVLNLFGSRLIDLLNRAGKMLAPAGTAFIPAAPSSNQFWFYTLAFATITFMGYQGQTFGLSSSVSRIPGQVMGLFIGLFNGWLIGGNLWY